MACHGGGSKVARQHRQIAVPMDHVTFWYDIFLHGGSASFCGLREILRLLLARGADVSRFIEVNMIG